MRHKSCIVGISLAAMIAAALPAFAAPSGEAVSLRRLTQEEYRNSIADIFGKEIEIRGIFEPTIRVGGLQATSTAVLSVTPLGFESFTKMADAIAIQVTSEKYRAKLPCAPKEVTAPDDACIALILGHYGRMLFRRPLTAGEVKRRVALAHAQAAQAKDFYAGLQYSFASLLQSAEFVFRKEVAVPVASGKNYALDPYSRATRLSYLMWNTTPDAELLDAAESGALSTPSGLSKQVDRLIDSPRLETGMRAFFNDFLELDDFDTVSKDSILYPIWRSALAASAREETLRTVIGETLRDNGDVRDLMTTQKTWINRSLSAVYSIAFPFTAEWVQHTFAPDDGRSGVLTQVSMLSMFSHPGRSSPTKRGVALMEIFLCEPTPAPPANVDFSVVNDTTGPLKTVRERLTAHATNSACASCHTHSDPIGLTLEGFDTIGSYRITENGQAIDVSATIQGKSFSGAQGLGKFMHDNPKYPACLARKLYSYAKGINSEDVSRSDVKDAYKAFQDSGFRLRALIKGMAMSESFYAASAPQPDSNTDTKVAAK